MANEEQSATDKAGHPRVSQACQRCRSLKTRCLPSERTGTCKRCFTSKRDCIWAETPRKPRRARGPSRISQVEQKIDGIVASIVNSEASRKSSTPAEIRSTATTSQSGNLTDHSVWPGSWLPFPESFEQHTTERNDVEASQRDNEPTQQFLEKIREIHNFGDDNDLSQVPRGVSQGTQKTEPGIENESVKNLLANGEADELLNEYRSMSASFPFVPLSATVNSQDLHNSKPMLFLAIITVASWKNRLRQKKLDRIYRTNLADRTIVTPRRTLSLLQSILVYLSRYHFIFSHKTQQIYSLQQVAIGIALDMGLHQRSKRSVLDIPGQPPLAATRVSTTEQRERQRTFLGCYYMSSMISGGLQKPNLLKFTEYMAECGQNLKQGCEFSSDAILGRLVGLRRLDDQIHDSFYSEDTFELPLADTRISMNFRFMENQLDELQDNECSAELQRVIDLSSSFTSMQLHAIALRSPPTSAQQNPQDHIQINALLTALVACKRHLDLLLGVPASEYCLMSFSEWMRLPYVLITLARLCIPSDALVAAHWDVKTAHERARLDLYLDSLCYRMQEISTSIFDFWSILKMILEQMKGWYTRKVNMQSTTTFTQANFGGIPTTNTLNSSTFDGAISGSPMPLPSNGVAVNAQCPFGSNGAVMDEGNESTDPFAFMNRPDFDMERFFDIGLWGDEAYVDLGFGMRF
ncbi:hypothetical protein P280DRAFT_464726 [Massarina eburnea CBS 473.64]|uniref:Zn(2)-C6 fungal-type domain-containing protein n=1 Tax=Massarina eburnea CBS 473.64 TaxID=1395130 RepID=A0A6A6SFI2_9PLEO|nr:hypothetical protein P280DRAFT_464726 [Massarina eburnea CBS 473.64]